VTVASTAPVKRSGHRNGYEHLAPLGLILAVDRFDPERGVQFLSFAVPTITGRCCGTSGTGRPRSGCRAGCASCSRKLAVD
jgi:hypothetical protein